jgi:hypothetical protein
MGNQSNCEPWSEEFYRLNKEGYLHDWVECLGALVGWPPEQVVKWSKKWQYGLDGLDDGLFYHEAPMYYITPLLIPPSLSARITALQRGKLCERLFVTIRHPCSYTPYGEEPENPETFDWQAAKQRVEAVVNEYGETLESIQYPVMVERPSS